MSTDRLPEYRKGAILDMIWAGEGATVMFGSQKLPGWLTPEEVLGLTKEMRKEVENGVYITLHIHAYTATA